MNTIEALVNARLDKMSPDEIRAALYDIVIEVVTDGGNLPKGFGPTEQGNQRDSCVDTVSNIEGILDDAGLNIAGGGEVGEEYESAGAE